MKFSGSNLICLETAWMAAFGENAFAAPFGIAI